MPRMDWTGTASRGRGRAHGRRTRRLSVGFVAVILASVGCDSTGPSDGLREEITRNRAVWERVEPARYGYTVSRLCFCPPAGVGPVRVEVVEGEVVRRTYVDSGSPVEAALADAFPDVDGLFDILEDALDRDAFRVTANWDPATGVPLDFSIDYIENAADEELGFRVDALPVAVAPF